MVLPLPCPLSLLPGESESSSGGVSPEEGREHGGESKILSQRKDGSGQGTKETSVRWGGGSRRFLLEYVSGRKGKSQGKRQLEQPGQKQKEGTNSKEVEPGNRAAPWEMGDCSHALCFPPPPQLRPSSFLIPLLKGRSPSPGHATVFPCPFRAPHSSTPPSARTP